MYDHEEDYNEVDDSWTPNDFWSDLEDLCDAAGVVDDSMDFSQWGGE